MQAAVPCGCKTEVHAVGQGPCLLPEATDIHSHEASPSSNQRHLVHSHTSGLSHLPSATSQRKFSAFKGSGIRLGPLELCRVTEHSHRSAQSSRAQVLGNRSVESGAHSSKFSPPHPGTTTDPEKAAKLQQAAPSLSWTGLSLRCLHHPASSGPAWPCSTPEQTQTSARCSPDCLHPQACVVILSILFPYDPI